MSLSDEGQATDPSATEDELSQLRRELARARTELDSTQARLVEVEERATNMFQLAPCVMLITTIDDFTILDVNETFTRESGYPREAVIGRRTTDLPWWPEPEVRDRLLETLAREGRVSNIEVRFLDHAGTEHIVMLNACRITVRGVPCMLTHTADITDRMRADEARKQLERAEEDRRRLESLGLVAGGIAHDFNNLLVGILGNAELLHGTVPADSAWSAPLRNILTSAEHAAEHTRELLDYAGRGPAHAAPIELGALTHEVVTLGRAHLSPGLELRHEAPETQVWVQGDRGQLSRMLANLVKNGLEAMAGRTGEVRLVLAVDGDEAVLEVVDGGTGMDEATRLHIFEPFFSTKQAGQGLGLASVHAIVQRHRGAIGVDTAPGQGTTFTIRLPQSAAPDEEEAHRLSTPEPPRHGHILVVDDDPTVRETGCTLLRELGFTVDEASDGAGALAAVQASARPFDAVVLDATMPGLSAADTLARLRALAPELPVLLCSGYSRNEFARLLAADPHCEFLPKPYRTSELVRMLAKAMG